MLVQEVSSALLASAKATIQRNSNNTGNPSPLLSDTQQKASVGGAGETIIYASVDEMMTSKYHVQWMMEIIGQGFSLPIEESIVISRCSIIYSQWLLEHQLCPAVIQNDTQQVFWQVDKLFHA